LAISLGVTHCQLQEAQEQNARMEQQLKELYGQVNELTLQYVEIVKRVQNHK
jgi:hypothetical protein